MAVVLQRLYPQMALLAAMCKLPQIREIRALLRDPQVRVTDVAKRYGVSRATLYKHVGTVRPKGS